MADAIVSAVASAILEKLRLLVLKEVGLARGLDTELENLASTFAMVQAVLQDAEEKQWKSKALEIWLRLLKDAAYDVDDVLDEFEIEAQRHRCWWERPLVVALKHSEGIKHTVLFQETRSLQY
jgi:hypothetical protein